MAKNKKAPPKAARYIENTMLPSGMNERLESGDYRSFSSEFDEHPTTSKFTPEIKGSLEAVGKVDRLELWIAAASALCVVAGYFWLR